MARSQLTKTALPALTSNGLNLTDATFTTMSTGADNGVEIVFDAKDLIVLKNTTGGTATYTFKIPAPASITAVGGGVTDATITVAAGKTHIMKATDILKQSDSDVYIDCDVAGDILVVDL